MTFFPVFPRQKKRHTNLWLFSQFSDGKKNDIQTYDFFPSFPTAKKTTYKPMTFFPVFGRQKKRHTNLWLFSQFSHGKKNDIQTYDFFPSFPTAKKTTYKPMTFFPVFGRHKKRHTNLWLFDQFSDGKKNDIQTYDFFPRFPTAKNESYKRLCAPCYNWIVWNSLVRSGSIVSLLEKQRIQVGGSLIIPSSCLFAFWLLFHLFIHFGCIFYF